MSAAVKTKPAPHSLEDRLLAARRDRKAVKALLGQAVLQGLGEVEVRALQEELDLHTREIERFTAAVEAQAIAQDVQSLDDRKAIVAAARNTIATRDSEIETLAAQLLSGINQLAPQAKRLKDAVEARNAALRTGLKAGLDRAAWDRINTGGVMTPLPYIAAALGTALIEAGLPAVGVHLEVATRTDAEQMTHGIEHARDRTERSLLKASACLRAPAVDDDEDDI